ncbi:hypothetical protein AN478_00380 [Thiohalorhabdus denitrificans]|uniref:Alpha/beta hydrolase family protein n=1 Tax=Thiohalorhabdus denitrificans TaxID=381306 RepID=A0A0P9CR74_9GAMM|nr:alpha/beta fold hydrolase [Thiohalorhabdus denitrificans]KPV41889.1 hypothetical protein AN478_00380 [Thiohalorhabdus denitrificans]SCY65564.1 Alpha/beta hydrolase family protein [Thiohalorhabdus denitrificans]
MPYLAGLLALLGGLGGIFLVGVHLAFRVPPRRETGTPAAYGLSFREVRIPTVRRRQLFAWWLPGRASAPTVIILHGWGANAELMLPLAAPFAAAGLNVLLLDARGHGRSDRDTFASMPRFAEDAGAAVDWVKAQEGGSRGGIVLVGHSVGAGAVLLEAGRRRDVGAVISIAAFAHPRWMMSRYLRGFRLPGAVDRLVQAYVQWLIGHRFADIAPLRTVCLVHCPLLLVHGEADATVPITDGERLASVSGARLLRIPGAGHGSVEEVEGYGEGLISWLRDSLPCGVSADKCGTGGSD